MTEENITNLKIEDLTVESYGGAGDILVCSNGGSNWMSPELEITPYECKVKSTLTVGGVDVMNKIYDLEAQAMQPLIAGEGIVAMDGGMHCSTTIEVDPMLMERINKLEAMVMDLAAKVEELSGAKNVPAKWDPAMHPATSEEVQNEIARRAQEQAEYDFEIMEHMNRRSEQAEEDATKAYERAMGIIE